MDGYTITNCFDQIFTLFLPTTEPAFSPFFWDCSTLTIQACVSPTRSTSTAKATTFPHWQHSEQSSQTFCRCVSSETLSLHPALLIPLA